jgi:hypothetical protein
MRRVYLVLWLISLLLLGIAALGIDSPGYMDADYYFATAQQVADGRGFTQPFLWNYLDNPVGLPHASHGYWMPLTTLVAALPLWLFHSHAFRVAQLPFFLLTSLMPAAVAYLAYQFHEERRWAILSGLLALFSGFYFTFFLTTDNFTLYAWIGGLVLWVAGGQERERRPWTWAILGALVGLAYLTRADGILLMFPVLWAAWEAVERRKWQPLALVLVGFAVVELPWWIRNLITTGGILSPSNGRVLWLTSYNQLFIYPAEKLTVQHWLQAGLPAILHARLEALWLNLQHALAEPGMIFMWPFVLIAIRKQRAHRWVRISVGYFLLMFLIMTVVFPFAGGRGGVFHSSASLLPLVWVLAPIGLAASIRWAAEKRNWDVSQAQTVFQYASVAIMAAVTLGLYLSQAFDPSGTGSDWDQSERLYQQVGDILDDYHLGNVRAVVNNPPGFWLATGLEAVVIPDGDIDTLQQVVRQFEVEVVILDQNLPSGLEDLYHDPNQVDWLRVVDRIERPQGTWVWIVEVNNP